MRKLKPCIDCSGLTRSTRCRACHIATLSVEGPRVCGFGECGEFGSSLDERYGRLCSMHNARLRSRLSQGHTIDRAYALLATTTRKPTNWQTAIAPADFKIQRVKERICRPIPEKAIHSLLMFHGGQVESRAAIMYNLLASAKDSEVKTFAAITKASQLLTDPIHYCGIHRTLDRFSLVGFCSRLWYSPDVLKMESDWRDYLIFLFENSRAFPYFLNRVSNKSAWSHRTWRRQSIRRPTVAPVTEYYPFIVGTPTSDHDLILAVDALVPKGIPSDARADICQDMLVSILTGEITLANLQDTTPRFVKRIYQDMPSKYGHLSLDAPLIYGDGKSRTLAETIV